MAQIFHPSTNTIARVSLLGGILILGGVGLVAALIDRSPYMTGVGVARPQPVPFSHAHHAGDLGFDCRYCHARRPAPGRHRLLGGVSRFDCP